MNISLPRSSDWRVWGGKVANKKSCVTSLRSAGVVERFEGVAETDGTPHPHFARLHPSESREGNSEDRSAVEYKIQHWRNQKTNLRSVWVCVCVCWGKLWVLTLEAILFWLLNTSTRLWSSTVVESLHIAYDGDNDLPHIGIILLCEVLAPSLLNMHECLKWILVDPPPPIQTPTPLFCPLLFIVKLYNHIPVY